MQMRVSLLIVSVLAACSGPSTTELFPEAASVTIATIGTDAGAAPSKSAQHFPASDAGSAPAPALVLSPTPELQEVVEDRAAFFRDLLGLPIEVRPGGILMQVTPMVYAHGNPVNAGAFYSHICRFDGCNDKVHIDFESAMMTEPKRAHLVQVVEHEIGHVLSSWGSVLHVDQHLPTGNIMQATFTELAEPTSEDISFWCSASPCAF